MSNSNPLPQNKKYPFKNGWALISVKACGLCGSDMQKINSGVPTEFILGHEVSGVVEYATINLSLIGKKVAIEPLFGCDNCVYCNEGSPQLCKDIIALGRNINGGFNKYLIIPEKNIHILPDDISYSEATLVDSIAVGLHGINKLDSFGIKHPANILILGDGNIGLIALILSKLILKPNKITLIAKNLTENHYLFKQFKVNVVNSSNITSIELLKAEYDIVIETVGRATSDLLNIAIKKVKPKGSILVYGVFPPNFYASIDVRELFYKEALLFGSNSYGYYKNEKEFQLAINVLNDNKDIFTKLISVEISGDHFDDGVTLMNNKNKSLITKVVYTY